MVITRVKNKSPEMIMTPFDVKFHERKDELPPEARNPPTKITQKSHRTKCYLKWVPQNPPPARPPVRGVQGAVAPQENLCV